MLVVNRPQRKLLVPHGGNVKRLYFWATHVSACACLSVSLTQPQGIGEPSVYHAVVVIFLEFFAWGLLTTPMLTVSHNPQMLA